MCVEHVTSLLDPNSGACISKIKGYDDAAADDDNDFFRLGTMMEGYGRQLFQTQSLAKEQIRLRRREKTQRFNDKQRMDSTNSYHEQRIWIKKWYLTMTR